MAPLYNYTTRRIYIFQAKGISPKLQETLLPVHVHQLAQVVWPWTGGLVTAPLCNHTETKEILFFSKPRDQPQTPRGSAVCPRASKG
jgi:hypothetical protein